jgi:hypothetical protein
MLRTAPWLLLIACMATPFSHAAAGQPQLPDFELVESWVQGHFASQKGRQASDLVTRRDVEQVLDGLKQRGWDVAERKEILESSLPGDDWLVQRLQTTAGRKFLREIASYPDAYDRLDRLRRLPDGRQILDRLIQGPDGYKLIEYLTNEPGGRQMGRMLSNTPKGKNFNQTTGRIYIASDLLKRLKESHTAAQQGAAKGRR